MTPITTTTSIGGNGVEGNVGGSKALRGAATAADAAVTADDRRPLLPVIVPDDRRWRRLSVARQRQVSSIINRPNDSSTSKFEIVKKKSVKIFIENWEFQNIMKDILMLLLNVQLDKKLLNQNLLFLQFVRCQVLHSS